MSDTYANVRDISYISVYTLVYIYTLICVSHVAHVNL